MVSVCHPGVKSVTAFQCTEVENFGESVSDLGLLARPASIEWRYANFSQNGFHDLVRT